MPNLVGLAWTAPYLHDSGVAVGPDAEAPARRSGRRSYRGVAPDPANSLRALVDRDLRAQVDRRERGLGYGADRPRYRRGTRVLGGCQPRASRARTQTALIAYLLSIDRLTEPAPTP
ncbi:hypothetical protein ACU4GR_19410 [Methylobacterium oryzae CBMB20]